eukprot:3093671-Amphidinium_carterae.1
MEVPQPTAKFRIQGLQRATTVLELYDLLAPLGYQVDGLEYSDAAYTVFTANSAGAQNRFQLKVGPMSVPVHIKAYNALAE